MLLAIVSAILAVAATFVTAYDKLTSRIRKAVVLGASAIAIAVSSQILQIHKTWTTSNALEVERRKLADANALVMSDLEAVDEASGGAIHPDTGLAYVVDDDERRLFEFRYNAASHRYELVRDLPLVDSRPCELRTDWMDECSEQVVRLKEEHLEDLEGAAFHDGHLLLITTFGNSNQGREEPRRRVLLEVTTEGHVVQASRHLAAAMTALIGTKLPCHKDKKLTSWSEDNREQLLRVEGLAVDDKDRVYIGLRAPLIDNEYALVLRTPAQELFDPRPTLEAFLLPLGEGSDQDYGIVSLDYDHASGRMLVLGNSPWRTRHLRPRIWSWRPGDCERNQTVEPLLVDVWNVLPSVGSRPAKPEVLLIRSTDLLHVFFDAEGTGGQIGYERRRDGFHSFALDWEDARRNESNGQ